MIKPDKFTTTRSAVAEKVKESAVSVLPIVLIVTLLCLGIAPTKPELLLCFFIGALMIVLGMGLFSLGAEQSMTPIGNKIGTALTKTKNLPLILGVSFLLGFAITIAEPDLQVLAETVPHIKNIVLLVTVGVGVGLFLVLAILRILFKIKLSYLLIGCYTVVFLIAFLLPNTDYLAVAFDSGGVTTGPMTVPFIMALGAGIASVRSDGNSDSDSFLHRSDSGRSDSGHSLSDGRRRLFLG